MLTTMLTGRMMNERTRERASHERSLATVQGRPCAILRRSKSGRVICVDPELALFANDAFYLAFSAKNAPAMDRLWAQHHPVVCIHPGWPALLSREAVMESWERILSNPDAPAIIPHHARAFPMDHLVMVVCYEALGGQMLTATNLFVVEGDEARLVHHQAGLCAQPPEPEPEGARTLQ